MKQHSAPKKQGLYNPSNEHDSCGVGFVANSKGVKSHKIVAQGLEILTNLTHRGATGYDPKLGDGAGILIQTPDALFQKEIKDLDFKIPAVGKYGVGMIFLPQDVNSRKICEKIISDVIAEEDQAELGWRDVPVENKSIAICELTPSCTVISRISINSRLATALEMTLERLSERSTITSLS